MTESLRQVSLKETEKILEFAHLALNFEGDFVELGCYRGDTSLLLEKMLENAEKSKKITNGSKTLWLYDSFAGLPEKTKEDSSVAGDEFKASELFVSKREVIERFKKANLKLPVIKKSFFENLNPETDLPEKISFAFLDGDLYSSIKTSLNLVVPKLSEQGIILVHDYNNPKLPGPARAVDEFLQIHPAFKLKLFETLAFLSR